MHIVLELKSQTWATRLRALAHITTNVEYTLNITLSFGLRDNTGCLLLERLPREVFDLIIDELNITSVLSLALTCKRLHGVLLESHPDRHANAAPPAQQLCMFNGLRLTVPTEHNISRRVLKLFAAYFPHDPQGFRRCLDDTRAIISGSSALHVLIGRTTWLPSDLDIIVPAQMEAHLTLFLFANGYFEVPRLGHGDGQYADLCINVVKFCDGRNTVDLIVADACNLRPIDIALSHHSTPAMNYITATHVHCPFPALTFNEQMAFNFSADHVRAHGVKVAINKYAVQRGFKWLGFRPPSVQWDTLQRWKVAY